MTESRAASETGRRNVCKAFTRDRSGATAVEFALVAAPFIALLIALLQTFLVFFAQQLLESVVQQSARLVMTGQVQAQTMAQDAFKQKVCDQVRIFFTCGGLMVDMQVASAWSSANTGMPTLTFDSQGTVTNVWQYNPGTAGDIVVLRVIYVWPVMLGPLGFNLSNLSNGNRQIMATAAFQNEPSS
ncbi:pilus biosynthesis protein TadE [Bradyrhizobium sp. SSBR45G]|uniref:TadE/TadG family type IV pilus assembly protein n=1 Tax=unclassified Bradyrhizobium TaxID=2631580 RepID=UPI002342BC7F|nr:MULTISPECIES: TadE/TadG family type IV pilus assembly protein [unclassified Bradyrhizobium]GLH75098.1 pilus biosynthesis protein TadE [Bradyrhizobium sp. SSBR45G]GLH83115.1 pilus biosynthesis protein TadE [Bradyrhizobium sp. SSBR45R]